jgi:hypothetical protein
MAAITIFWLKIVGFLLGQPLIEPVSGSKIVDLLHGKSHPSDALPKAKVRI